jgi:hypothetical protein
MTTSPPPKSPPASASPEAYGGINGFSSWIGRFPDDDAVVIALSDFEGANAGAVTKQLAAILFDEK